MKAIIYAGAVIGCHQTAVVSDDQIVTEGQVYAAFDPSQVEILDVDQDVTGYTYVDGKLFPPARLLLPAQQIQIAALAAAYQQAITQPISFTTAGGVTRTFQSDQGAQTVLMQATQGYTLAGSVPDGFYWVSADNAKTPFSLADLSGLYAAMLAQGWAAFQRLQNKKADVIAARTTQEVQAVTW